MFIPKNKLLKVNELMISMGQEKGGTPRMQGYPDKLLKNNALKIDTRGYPDKLMKKQEIQVYWRLAEQSSASGVYLRTESSLRGACG